MPDLYEKHLPRPEVAVQLAPEELALYVLRYVSDRDAGKPNRYNFTLMSATSYSRTVDRAAVGAALAEAWAWLEREGLIVPRPGEQGEWFQVSRRGEKLLADADFKAYKHGNLLRRDSLDPFLEKEVWPLFIREAYDTSVFQAFKIVEVKVRALGGFKDSDLGVPMMRRAFKPDGGPLTDPGQEPGEREAMAAFFAGAIGLFKNPGSHRAVKFEPAEAAEAIYLANTLLRLLARIETRLKGTAAQPDAVST